MINQDKWIEILKKGYSLDIIYFLQLIERGEKVEKSPKVEVLLQTVLRKGLLTEDKKLTLEGNNLLNFVKSPSLTVYKKEKVKDDVFLKWWLAYPSNDTFEYKNKKFEGSRALKAKKADCEEKLKKILSEGEYTIDELIGALEIEVHQKKEASVKEGKNKLSYMQNSLTYLNQRTYEAFIDLYKSGFKNKKEETFNGVDI